MMMKYPEVSGIVDGLSATSGCSADVSGSVKGMSVWPSKRYVSIRWQSGVSRPSHVCFNRVRLLRFSPSY